jgi:DNA-binding NtrC family response regulator
LELRAVAGQPLSLSGNSEEQLLYIPVGTSIAEAERWMIFATLKKCGGNKTRAAALLGVSLKTLYNRLNAYRADGRADGLEVGDLDTESAEVES